jgi:hypothetical protein
MLLEDWRVYAPFVGVPDPYSSANGILCPCQKILKYLRSPPTS